MGIPNVWNPFCENHRHRRHIVIFPLKQQVENDDPDDGVPLLFDLAAKSLVQNSAPAIFTSYSQLSPAGWIMLMYPKFSLHYQADLQI